MCLSIEFDHQPGAEANKVPDVLAYRMLSAELVAVELSSAKAGPQQLFCIVRVPSQFPCPLRVDRIASHAQDDPCERGARERDLHTSLSPSP